MSDFYPMPATYVTDVGDEALYRLDDGFEVRVPLAAIDGEADSNPVMVAGWWASQNGAFTSDNRWYHYHVLNDDDGFDWEIETWPEEYLRTRG